jgi:hypothetical protein
MELARSSWKVAAWVFYAIGMGVAHACDRIVTVPLLRLRGDWRNSGTRGGDRD